MHFDFFLLHSHENRSKFLGQQGWVEILMIILVSSKFLAMRNATLYSVSMQNRNVFVEFFVEYYYRNDVRFKDSPKYFQYVKYKEVLRIYAIRICLILGLLMNAKNKKCMTTHLTKGIVVRSGFHADLGSSHYLGAEYLFFVSSRSLKTREKYTN